MPANIINRAQIIILAIIAVIIILGGLWYYRHESVRISQEKPLKTRLDIHKLIDNIIELRSYVLSTSNIEVIKKFKPDLPWVSVNAGQMQQVFIQQSSAFYCQTVYPGGTAG